MSGDQVPPVRGVARRLTFSVSPSAIVGLVVLTYLFLQVVSQPSAAVITKAVGLSLLLFLTVVVHEFGHAAVALAMGLEPVSIRIHALGGATSYARRRPSPAADAAIAFAGPAATVVLGLLAAIGMRLTTGSANDLMTFWRDACVVLTIFNLLPGLPLDGGAIVKAVVWALNHDERKATRFAAGTGLALTLGLAGFALYSGLHSGSRTSIAITLLLAITIGSSAYRTWQYAAPGGPRVRPSILGGDAEPQEEPQR